MSARKTYVREPARPSCDRVEELEAELAALTDQRLQELERLRVISLERDRLRFELSERNADERRPHPKGREAADGSAEGEGLLRVDDWLFKAGVERAKWRQEQEIRSSVLARVTASLLLRFAKAAARDSHYATAEVFYQAIILLKPRSFVWRQAGNMLAGQGLFRAAIDCFDRAIAMDDADAAAWHAKAIAWRRLDEAEESRKAMKQAIALLPSLGQDPRKR